MDNQTNVGALATRFFDNETGYGFIINKPGLDPIIFLNRTLLGENPFSPIYKLVYNALLDYYHSLNIWEFVFPFRKFYEELEPQQPFKPDVIILGRFKRSETHCKACEVRIQGYRLIG